MTKTKKIIIQAVIPITVLLFFIFFSDLIFRYFPFKYSMGFGYLSYYLSDSFSMWGVALVGFIIYYFPVLIILTLFRIKKETPRLDRVVRIIFYLCAVILSLSFIIHIGYLLVDFNTNKNSILSFLYYQDYFDDNYFWINIIILNILYYLIPAVLFFVSARLLKERHEINKKSF